jgi:hypothetical protein
MAVGAVWSEMLSVSLENRVKTGKISPAGRDLRAFTDPTY